MIPRTFGLAIVLLLALPPPALSDSEIENPTVRTTFDETTFTVHYPSSPLVPATGVAAVEIGREAAEAGVAAYDAMVLRNVKGCGSQDNPSPTQWGFITKDLDCDIPVHVLGIVEAARCRVTVYGGSENPELYIPVDTVECLRASGYYKEGGVGEIIRVAVAHEFFHHLQYAMGLPSSWNMIFESPARFIQTLVEPDLEDQDSSLWYAGGTAGANGLQSNPSRALCQRVYDAASFWGFLYARDGGMEGLRHILDASRPSTNWNCSEALPPGITRGLSTLGVAHEHDTFEEAFADFAVSVYTKDFSWGTPDGRPSRDWGSLLDDVRLEQQAEGTTSRSVGAWGLQYVRLPADSSYAVSVANDDGQWHHRLFLKDDAGALTIQDLAGGPVQLDGNAYAEAVVQSARLASTTGTYQVAVDVV